LTDKELLHKNLIVSILALASDKQNQIDFTIPGCSVCDLIEDFDTYGNRCYDSENYSKEQSARINELKVLIDKFCELKTECFDPNVLDHPMWIGIRIKARETLYKFEYLMSDLPKSIEKEDGVWYVNINDYELKRNTK